MPIYEYQCEDCGASFDKFVRSQTASFQVECPKCHSKNCRKQISMFGSSVGSGATSGSGGANCAPGG
jgi:putative FmdB family regulatory protein